MKNLFTRSTKHGFIWLFGFLFLLLSISGNAQSTDTKTPENDQYPSNFTPLKKNEIYVTGFIVSDQDGSQLPAIQVVQRNMDHETQTDGDGYFQLALDTAQSDVLVLSFTGMITQELKIIPGQTHYNIVMKLDESLLEDVVLLSNQVNISQAFSGGVGCGLRPRFFHSVWTKIKTPFRKKSH